MVNKYKKQHFISSAVQSNHLLKLFFWKTKKRLQNLFVRSFAKSFLFLFFFGFICCGISYALSCGEEANPALKTVCDIIMFLQGRIGRSLISFSVMLAAWGFINGGFKWNDMLTMAIGIGLFLAPKTFAVWLLPEYIEGITGDGYDVSVKYTPDEIISCACPNLR